MQPLDPDKPVTAAGLREYMAEREAERRRVQQIRRSKEGGAEHDLIDAVIHDHFGPDDCDQLLARIRHAVDHGHLEVMAMRFPSDLCTDSGRAINNSAPDWVDTLPGKAHELYELWHEKGRPAGFHFKAMIIDFPDGIPGDVGLFVSWAE